MDERALYETIIETTRALIVVLDAEGRIVLFNPACERITGYRSEEVRGRAFWDFLLAPDERDPVKAVFNDLRAGRFPSEHRNYWVAKSGERRLIEWSNSAVTDDRGLVTHVIGTGIDITEQLAAENALREFGERLHETHQRQKALLDSIPEIAWLKNGEGRYVAVNRVFGRVFRVDTEQVAGKTDFDIFPPEVASQFAREDRVVRASGEPWRHEELVTRAAGQKWMETVKVPIKGDAGEIIGIAGTSRDITERKLAEAQRIARDAAQRTALVKEIHHRIKNNLQGVITMVERWADHHPAHADLWDAVTTRINAIASMHGLHGATGERDLRLDHILPWLVSSFKTIHADLPVQLSICGGAAGGRVIESEIVGLALVINELIMNAYKHSRGGAQGKPIEVALDGDPDSGCARITVLNHAGRLPQQFDFDAGAGLGTGLTLVKSLLPMRGAQLRIENHGAHSGVRAELALRPPVITATDSRFAPL
jgi:PAS domain S-box-containing protein